MAIHPAQGMRGGACWAGDRICQPVSEISCRDKKEGWGGQNSPLTYSIIRIYITSANVVLYSFNPSPSRRLARVHCPSAAIGRLHVQCSPPSSSHVHTVQCRGIILVDATCLGGFQVVVDALGTSAPAHWPALPPSNTTLARQRAGLTVWRPLPSPRLPERLEIRSRRHARSMHIDPFTKIPAVHSKLCSNASTEPWGPCDTDAVLGSLHPRGKLSRTGLSRALEALETIMD